MDSNKVMHYFNLESNPILFKLALSPPSCGGGDQFKNLALEGDKLIDPPLIQLFNQKGIHNVGDIRMRIQKFHHKDTLIRIGLYFHLGDFMHPITDPNHQMQESEIKESVEALIGACARVNGPDFASAIVEKLFLLAVEQNFLAMDYISDLNRLLQAERNGQDVSSIWLPPENHLGLWIMAGEVEYRGHIFTATSPPWQNKDIGKKEVAKQILHQILGNIIDEPNSILIPAIEEVPIRVKQSLLDRQIVFSKPEKNESESPTKLASFQLNESIVAWAEAEANKNPYGLLLELSGLVPEIQGSAWIATTSVGELSLLTLEIAGIDKKFFEVGYGSSKSKARKVAADKILNASLLFDWLKAHYKDVTFKDLNKRDAKIAGK